MLLVADATHPAAAANSATEYLDENNDRPFGGINRYYTASALADQLITTHSGSLNLFDTLVITSGTGKAPDAAIGSGLAGAREAALLLTETDQLHPLAERFIERNDIREVLVLGGPQAISQTVIDELAEIDQLSETDIIRVAGEDRIATSVAVARMLGEPGEYCDSGLVSAILVNANSPVDAAVVAPLAYKLKLPVLYTNTDSLTPQITAYLTEAEIEHVVVMGSTAELSPAIIVAAQAAGVMNSTRIEGNTPAARSATLAANLQRCNRVAVADATFALVDARNPLDAAAAGPLLGAGLGAPNRSGGGGGASSQALVPILLVDDTLPSEVSLLLEKTRRQDATEAFVSAQLVALGGTERISDAVMEAALDAVVTSPPLTAQIAATVDSDTVTISFSDAVTDEPATTVAGLAQHDVKRRDNYFVAGSALLPADQFKINGRTVIIELASYTLQAGDIIEVANGAIKGAADDNRTVKGVRLVVLEAKPDLNRPELSLELAQNSPVVVVLVDEANPLGAESKPLAAGDINVERADGTTVPLAENAVVMAADGRRYVVDLQGDLRLQVGDVVRVAADAIRDASGRSSRSRRATVVSNQASPRVVTATISDEETLIDPGVDGLIGTADDVVRVARLRLRMAGEDAAPGTWVACDVSAGEDCLPEFELKARTNGRENGVAGNKWSLQLSYDATVSEIEAVATTGRSVVSVTYGAAARVSDVIAALQANDAVVSRFEILDSHEAADPLMRPPPPSANGAGPSADSVLLKFSGGAGRVKLKLTYNDVLAAFNGINFDGTNLDGAGTGSDTNTAICALPANSPASLVDLRAGGALRAAQTSTAFVGSPTDPIIWEIAYDPPARTATVTLTSSTDQLPTAASTLVLPAGLGVNFDCALSAAVDEQRLLDIK